MEQRPAAFAEAARDHGVAFRELHVAQRPEPGVVVELEIETVVDEHELAAGLPAVRHGHDVRGATGRGAPHFLHGVCEGRDERQQQGEDETAHGGKAPGIAAIIARAEETGR